MPLFAASRNEPLEIALCEALDSVASPEVREAAVREALTAQGLSAVPVDPERFAAFVSGPLRRAVVASLGDELGRAALADLERLAGAVLITRDARRAVASMQKLEAVRVRSPRITPAGRRHARAASLRVAGGRKPASNSPGAAAGIAERTSPTNVLTGAPEPRVTADALPATRRRFLVSTTRSEVVRILSSHVEPDVDVLQCWNVTGLLQALQIGGPPLAIFVDCEAPGAKPPSVAALAEDFPSLQNTVLLGGDAMTLTELARVSPLAVHWRVVDLGDDMAEIIAQYTRPE